ncbi:MAG TPA: TIGR03564 family F420-dependent LLM class oxidoreductase [Trebonia sp.]|jgi:F420-dependent oxidoreductase-like protein
MHVGVMVGPERGDTARKVARMLDDIAWADAAGLRTAWIPQIPNDMDALQCVALLAAHTTRIELGTAVVPLQPQHPVALARQALSAQAISGGRLTLGVGPSHHWIVTDMLGLPYAKPAAYTRDYLEVLDAAWQATARASGPGLGRIDVENESFTVHNPFDVSPVAPVPVLVSALGPVMLRIAGERADGTVLWMADERAIGEHIAPKITKAAASAGRQAPRVVAGIPVTLCTAAQVDEARERANRLLAEAEFSPNYQRLLEHGDIRDVGGLLAVGDEAAIAARFRQFADAGATDLSVRLLPIGAGRDELLASKRRARELLASLAADFA